MKVKIKEEKNYFNQFSENKKKLIKSKKGELFNIQKEIVGYSRDLNFLKREIREIELKLQNVKENDERINQLIKTKAEKLREQIKVGIPTDQDRRLASIGSLIMDIDSGKSSASESFIRILTFMNTEELMGFDSQVLQKNIKIKDKFVNATLIRIGRVFFAAVTKDKIYLYKKVNGRYIIDIDTNLGFAERRNIQLAIKIIQGKKPPKLINLPFYQKDINQIGDKK